VNSATPTSRLIDSAILLALLSALCYATSFAFAWGYGKYFDVPAVLVEANPKNVLVCAAAALVGISLLVPLLELVLPIWSGDWPRVVKKSITMVLIPVMGAAIILFLVGRKAWPVMVLMTLYVVMYAIDEFVLPLFEKGPTTYLAKMEARWLRLAPQDQKAPDLFGVLYKRLDAGAVNYAVYALVALGLAHGFGYREARTQEDFLVNGTLNCALVGTFGDSLICSDFDRKSQKIINHLRLIPMRESGIELQLQRIGPLVPADDLGKSKGASAVISPPKIAPTAFPPAPTIFTSPQGSTSSPDAAGLPSAGTFTSQ
jgi:hypothetical protein